MYDMNVVFEVKFIHIFILVSAVWFNCSLSP